MFSKKNVAVGSGYSLPTVLQSYIYTPTLSCHQDGIFIALYHHHLPLIEEFADFLFRWYVPHNSHPIKFQNYVFS